MKNLYILTFLFYLASCNSDKTINQENNTDTTQTLAHIRTIKYVEQKIEKTDINFLCDCDSLEFWSGGIQGISASDSTGPYCMGQCYTNLNFDIILYSKDDLELRDCMVWKNKKVERILDSIPNVEYYAFEIPKTRQLEPEDEFDKFEYVYPSEVKVYKKYEDGWYLIRTERVNNFEELSRLKVNAIFKI